jgi:transposase-like protein
MLLDLRRVSRACIPKAGYTVRDVATRLDVERWTVRDWCRTGRVRATKNAYGKWVVSPEEMARLEREGTRVIDTSSTETTHVG